MSATEELYLDAFRRQERLRERVQRECDERQKALDKECTFTPRISRRGDDDDPDGENDVTRRLYQDADTKSIKMQKLIARLQKKKLMMQPTFKPDIPHVEGDEGEFDVEKLTERLFQNAKESTDRRERTRAKFYKTVCPFQPNLSRKMKAPGEEEEALDIQKMVERLYTEEVQRREALSEWRSKKRQKAEGLTFHPNLKAKNPPKVNQEDLEKLVENLWQESKERKQRQEAVLKKEEKKIRENIGKLPKDMYRRPQEDGAVKLSPEELGEKLYKQKDEMEEGKLKKKQQLAKMMLLECNNFSPIIEKAAVAKEMMNDRILEERRFARNPFSPQHVQLGRKPQTDFVHPLGYPSPGPAEPPFTSPPTSPR